MLYNDVFGMPVFLLNFICFIAFLFSLFLIMLQSGNLVNLLVWSPIFFLDFAEKP